jgi:NAD(P)-dependent dehydrogenase (short-subunit alcohol dehydrogenase family)
LTAASRETFVDMPRKKPLSEQVVVVVGSYGLARAIAREVGRRGARVVVAARGPEAVEGTVRDVEDAGSQAHGVVGDLADPDVPQRIVDEAVDRFGRIDTVVASNLVTIYAEVVQLEPDELDRVFAVNFFGRVRLFRAALPELRTTRGTYIDVNSALAYRGIPLQAAYCSTKAAMRTLLESARVELRKERAGVDICVVLPGAINTPQFDRARQKMGLQPQPVPPIYEPEPFAEAVAHCCERPVRELPISWGAQKLLWGQKLSPRAGDLVLLRNGWKGQHTNEPKPQDSPDNLFDTLPGDPGAHGRFDGSSRGSTAWTWLRLRRGRIVAGAALGTMGLLASRSGRFPTR